MAVTDEPPPTEGAAKMRAHRARRATVRQLAAALVAEDAAEAAQQALLPLAPAGDLDELAPPAPSPAGGRPAGAVDRKAADWRAYMLARYRSPLVVLAETWSRSAAELAAELGCKPVEAFQLQLKAAIEGAAYLHSKAPASLQLEGASVAPIMVSITPGMATRLGVAGPPIIEVVEDQAVSDGGGEQV